MRPLRCFARASITAQGHAFLAFSTFSSNPRTSMLEEASRGSKMLALGASSKPQEPEKVGPWSPSEGPGARRGGKVGTSRWAAGY